MLFLLGTDRICEGDIRCGQHEIKVTGTATCVGKTVDEYNRSPYATDFKFKRPSNSTCQIPQHYNRLFSSKESAELNKVDQSRFTSCFTVPSSSLYTILGQELGKRIHEHCKKHGGYTAATNQVHDPILASFYVGERVLPIGSLNPSVGGAGTNVGYTLFPWDSDEIIKEDDEQKLSNGWEAIVPRWYGKTIKQFNLFDCPTRRPFRRKVKKHFAVNPTLLSLMCGDFDGFEMRMASSNVAPNPRPTSRDVLINLSEEIRKRDSLQIKDSKIYKALRFGESVTFSLHASTLRVEARNGSRIAHQQRLSTDNKSKIEEMVNTCLERIRE